MPAASRKRRAVDTPQRNSKRLKSAPNGDGESALNTSHRQVSQSDSNSDSDSDASSNEQDVHPTSANSSSPLASLDTTTLGHHLPRQRAHILNRLSGQLCPTSQLIDLDEQASTLNITLQSTVQRGESNSILLVGPKGSGKSALLQRALHLASDTGRHRFHHVQLSALMCPTDRSAMRELARQLISTGALGLDAGAEDRLGLNEEDHDGEDSEQEVEDGDDQDEDEREGEEDAAANTPLKDGDVDDEDDDAKAALGTAVLSSLSSTTSSILSLLASTNAKAAPLIITLDHFDLLTTRPRQALLYCLLDAVQSGTYKPGLAVVGMTRRVDTVDLLEKRVKSRFSHRIVQCYPPAKIDRWTELVRSVLTTTGDAGTSNDDDGSFATAWKHEVDALLDSPQMKSILTSTIELTQDVQHLFSILYPVISQLSLATSMITPNQPHLYAQAQEALLVDETIRQLYHLPTLAFLFVIAAKQLQLRDRVVFNFEVAFDEVRRFSQRTRREREGAGTGGMGLNVDKGVTADDDAKHSPKTRRHNNDTANASASASATTSHHHHPWEDRKRAMMAFEHLLALEIFLPDAFLSTLASGPTSTTTTTTDTIRPSTQHTFKTSVNAHSTVRKEYLRVRSVLNSFVVVEVAKERAAKGTLGTEVAQWASRSIA